MTEEQVAQISDQIAEISANPEQYGLSSMVLSSQRPDVNWQETAVVYKQLMTDSSDMQKALYNVKNTVHPSYQIHPYIYDFSQTTDIKSPIGSKFHCSIPKRYDE
jgi:hypothetical protein